MKAEKLLHRGAERIKIDFPYNQEVASELRKIPDCKWSQSHKVWHIPYTKDAFRMLKALFPEIEFVKNEVQQHEEQSSMPVITLVSGGLSPVARGIYVYVLDRRIIVKMPKNEADIQFITSLRFTKWDAGTRSWNIPNYPGNTEKIKAHFAGRITRWEEAFADMNDSGRSARKAEVLAIKTLNGRIKLIFAFQK